jgi:hypothetical protein
VNPILWWDAQVLDLTQKFANWFNWLTGKDNYWLTKQLTLITASIWAIDSYLDSKSVWNFSPFLFFLWAYFHIRNLEKHSLDSELNQLKGYKNLLSLFAYTRVGFTALIMLGRTLRTNPDWIDLIGETCLILTLYLISIDKPPYQKSKAWEWLTQTRSVSSVPREV